MKRVVIDCDGVLCEFNAPMHALLSTFGTMQPLPIVDGVPSPHCWDWYRAYGATPEMIEKAHAAMTPEWWVELPQHADAVTGGFEFLGRLHSLMHDCDTTLVSARGNIPAGITREWFSYKFGVRANVLHTSSRKIMALIAMEPAVIIEDNAATLAHYAAAEKDYGLPPCLKILIARSYNTAWHAGLTKSGVVIATSTSHALELAQGALSC